jgi:hypothetical protein
MSYDDSLVYLKTFGRHLETDVEKFFETAISFKITKQMLKDLERFHAQEKDGSDIEFDLENKNWVLVRSSVSGTNGLKSDNFEGSG